MQDEMDTSVDVDELLRGLGTWGKYQKGQLALLLSSVTTCAFQLLSVVFSGYRPPSKCNEPMDDEFVQINDFLNENTSLYFTYEKCHINVYTNETNGSFVMRSTCPNGYSYSVPRDRTFVTEWNLVCAGEERAELSQTLLVLGQMIGASVFTSLSDRYGRKPVFVSCHIAMFALGVGASFAPDVVTFTVLRLLIGIAQQGLTMSNAVMLLELFPCETRFMGEIFAVITWSSSLAIISPIAYLFRNIPWRYFYLTLSLYSSYSLFGYWTCDETIRWLLANGKTKQAEHIVRKACKMNKRKYEDVIQNAKQKTEEEKTMITVDASVFVVNSDQLNKETDETTKGDTTMQPGQEIVRYNFITILKEKRIFFMSMIMWYTWTVNSLTYFGLSLSSSTFSGNRFVNFFLLCVAEYPASFINFVFINRCGRKKMCMIMHAVAGLALAGASITSVYSEGGSLALLERVFFLIGKLGITSSFSIIFLFTPELYPTNLRNVGMGFSSAAGRIGGMLAPFAGPLAERIKWLPGAIFAVLCLLVTILVTFLPETKGHELPTTIEELKTWYKEHSGGRKSKKQNTNINESD